MTDGGATPLGEARRKNPARKQAAPTRTAARANDRDRFALRGRGRVQCRRNGGERPRRAAAWRAGGRPGSAGRPSKKQQTAFVGGPPRRLARSGIVLHRRGGAWGGAGRDGRALARSTGHSVDCPGFTSAARQASNTTETRFSTGRAIVRSFYGPPSTNLGRAGLCRCTHGMNPRI